MNLLRYRHHIDQTASTETSLTRQEQNTFKSRRREVGIECGRGSGSKVRCGAALTEKTVLLCQP